MIEAPRWPARVASLCGVLLESPGACDRRVVLAELWVLLHLALLRYGSMHASRMGGFVREDIEDVASQKALELLRRFESGSWEPVGRAPGEVAAYVSAVARNGLIDQARQSGRGTLQPLGSDSDEAEATPSMATDEEPGAGVERGEFVASLRVCAERLAPRSRRIWFFRLFYEMPSKEIASHPEVGLKPSHVDVVLQRCRQEIRDCMSRKGHASETLPPGTFAELWKSFQPEREELAPAVEESLDVR